MKKVLVCHFGVLKKSGWGRTFSLAEGLTEFGYDVTLLTTNNGYSLKLQRLKIGKVLVLSFPEIVPVMLSSKGFGFLSLFLKLIYSLLHKYDVVQSDSGHRPSSGWPCILNKLVHKSLYIAEWWDFFGYGGQLDDKPKYFKILFGRFEAWSEINDKKNADGIVLLSEFMKSRAQSLGFSSNKMRIIHGGADVRKIGVVQSPVAKEKNGIALDHIVFGYIGISNGEINDLHPFLKAIEQFKGRVRFAVFGKKLDKEIIDKYNLKDIIIEYGWIDYGTNSSLLSIVDVFVLIKEDNIINQAGWPNKLGDYLANGRPTLLTPYGDVSLFVRKYPNAFIVTERSIDSIVSIIKSIISNEIDIYEKGNYARFIAESQVSWDNKASELIDFYIERMNQNDYKS